MGGGRAFPGGQFGRCAGPAEGWAEDSAVRLTPRPVPKTVRLRFGQRGLLGSAPSISQAEECIGEAPVSCILHWTQRRPAGLPLPAQDRTALTHTQMSRIL